MVAAAMARVRAPGLVADAAWIPLADGSMDAVIANHMLYHVSDRRRALAEIHRLLRPGGRLYATTNGLGHMAELREPLGEHGWNEAAATHKIRVRGAFHITKEVGLLIAERSGPG
jgi:ubiquinone/menaquinone biosynthesis C-methylase UbiE